MHGKVRRVDFKIPKIYNKGKTICHETSAMFKQYFETVLNYLGHRSNISYSSGLRILTKKKKQQNSAS